MNATATAAYVEPIFKTARVRAAPAKAFAVFTAGMSQWTPLGQVPCDTEFVDRVAAALAPYAPHGDPAFPGADGIRQPRRLLQPPAGAHPV